METLYDTLKINKDASLKEIKKSYYKLAEKYHPDKNDGKESQEFIDITTAYTILKDTAKRKEYDQTGKYDTQIIDIRHLALQILANLLLNIINHPHWSFAHNDLFDLIKRDLEIRLSEIQIKYESISLQIERLDEVNNRISGKDFLFNEVVLCNLNSQKIVQANIEKEKNIVKKAQEIIKDYKYKVDQQEFISSMNNVMSSTTSTMGV